MRVTLIVTFAALALACNSAPRNTCTIASNSIAAGAQPGRNCNGVCVDISGSDAGSDASSLQCLVDCTDAGNPACDQGTQCFPVAPISTHSYCLIPCDDAGSCESPLVCADAGFCY